MYIFAQNQFSNLKKYNVQCLLNCFILHLSLQNTTLKKVKEKKNFQLSSHPISWKACKHCCPSCTNMQFRFPGHTGNLYRTAAPCAVMLKGSTSPGTTNRLSHHSLLKTKPLPLVATDFYLCQAHLGTQMLWAVPVCFTYMSNHTKN